MPSDTFTKKLRARLHILRGDAGRNRGDWTKARTEYSKALALIPSRGDIWVQLGHAFKESGDLYQADESYARALSINPNVADTHLQIGHLRKLQGDLDGAAASYGRALWLDQAMSPAARELAWIGRPAPKPDADHFADGLKAISHPEGTVDRQSRMLDTLERSLATLRANVETSQNAMMAQAELLHERVETVAARTKLSADLGLELSTTRKSLAKVFNSVSMLEAARQRDAASLLALRGELSVLRAELQQVREEITSPLFSDSISNGASTPGAAPESLA